MSDQQQEQHKSDQHNLLLPHLSRETPLGRHVLDHIEQDGYVVLPAIFTASECATELDRLWDFIEATSPSLSRDRPETWYPRSSSDPDPWPHSGWKFLPDMCQSYQSGWLFSGLREKLADRVFEPLYGTRELHSSKEGFTFHRPGAPPPPSSLEPGEEPPRLVHPLVGKKRPHVCNKPSHTNGEHFDQRAAHTGLHCIQSSTALLDQTNEDGCFLCWPGSHKEHARITKDIWRGRTDWVPLTDEECAELSKAGYSPKRVPVSKGDVILWRSDLCHCGASPIGLRPGFRAVSYTCMLPAKLTPDDVHENKLNEYFSGLSGDHRPNVRMCHLSVPKKKEGSTHKTKKGEELHKPRKACGGQYFDGGLPALTMRQAELYGLVRYNDDGGGSRDEHEEERQWILSAGGN
jgi:hypothetical protein